MNTLGMVRPDAGNERRTTQRMEAIERLLYLALHGGCGVLSDASDADQSLLLNDLAGAIRREGVPVSELNLLGVSSEEIPRLVAAELGLGLDRRCRAAETWGLLLEHGQASRLTQRRVAFIIDHADQALDGAATAIARVMQIFGESASWVFGFSSAPAGEWLPVLQPRLWLKVESGRLERSDADQILMQERLANRMWAPMTPEAMDSAFELSRGELARLRRLAELSGLAAEAEGRDWIDGELVRSVAEELLG